MGPYKKEDDLLLKRTFGKQFYSPDDDRKTVETCCDINKLNWMLYILWVALDGTGTTG
jgi:hypothetical protein